MNHIQQCPGGAIAHIPPPKIRPWPTPDHPDGRLLRVKSAELDF